MVMVMVMMVMVMMMKPTTAETVVRGGTTGERWW